MGNHLKLGFYHHITVAPTDDGLFIIGHMGRFLDSLANCCDKLTLFMHETSKLDGVHDYCLKSDNISWVNLGLSRSAPYRTLFGEKYRRIVKKYLDELDAILLRGPSPLLPGLARLGRFIPIALLIGGDYLAGVDSLPQPHFRKELIRIWSLYYNRSQLKAAKRSLTFVNSQKLFEEFRPYVNRLIETKTTTLSTSDFYWREDTCQNNPIHLLYTGRMDRAKGLLDMIEAVRLLRDQNLDIILDLVGKVDQGDRVLEEVRLRATEAGLLDRIVYHGYRSLGPDLFSFYKKADIYILASQSSFEGFPRTIWEALAHSLPVVATRVGSIPYYLQSEKNALLIDPCSPIDLASAISRVIHDGRLRKKIIMNGFEVPKSNTLEKRSLELVANISRYCEELRTKK